LINASARSFRNPNQRTPNRSRAQRPTTSTQTVTVDNKRIDRPSMLNGNRFGRTQEKKLCERRASVSAEFGRNAFFSAYDSDLIETVAESALDGVDV
ncbi:hypothetical protein HDU97_009887, partial [Phlyctochytrium planicorne]